MKNSPSSHPGIMTANFSYEVPLINCRQQYLNPKPLIVGNPYLFSQACVAASNTSLASDKIDCARRRLVSLLHCSWTLQTVQTRDFRGHSRRISSDGPAQGFHLRYFCCLDWVWKRVSRRVGKLCRMDSPTSSAWIEHPSPVCGSDLLFHTGSGVDWPHELIYKTRFMFDMSSAALLQYPLQ